MVKRNTAESATLVNGRVLEIRIPKGADIEDYRLSVERAGQTVIHATVERLYHYDVVLVSEEDTCNVYWHKQPVTTDTGVNAELLHG